MPNPIVLAQADPSVEARAEQVQQRIEAQIERLEQQIQGLEQQADQLTNEVQAPPARPDDFRFNDEPPAVAVIVPVAFFLLVGLTLFARWYLAYKARQDVQNTVRAALERGTPLTSEVLDKLVETPAPKRSDLRRGAVWMALGLGSAAFGLIVGEPDAVRPMVAAGLLFALLGAAYLGLWYLNERKKPA